MSVTIYFDGETRRQYTDLRAFNQTDKMKAVMRLPEGLTDAALGAGVAGIRRVLDEMGEDRAKVYAEVELGWRPE